MRTGLHNSDKGESSPHTSCVPSASLSKARPHILMLVSKDNFPPMRRAAPSRLHSFAKYWGELTRVSVVTPKSAPSILILGDDEFLPCRILNMPELKHTPLTLTHK